MSVTDYWLAAFASLFLTFGVVAAQETPPAAAPTAPAAAKSDKPLREQTIYIPYSKLRETFEKEGRGVYLPYDQFQELWRKARLADQPQIEQRPPAGRPDYRYRKRGIGRTRCDGGPCQVETGSARRRLAGSTSATGGRRDSLRAAWKRSGSDHLESTAGLYCCSCTTPTRSRRSWS